MDWTYELLDISPSGLPVALSGLRNEGVAGANVTIPHKQAVMEHMDALDAEAVRARAVNTIVREGDRLVGSNTDIAAIRSAIARVGVEPKGANVVIFGTGGSARAASVALGGAHVTFVSRHPDEADVAGKVIAWDDVAVPGLVRAADLLVNATPLGRRDEMPIRPAALPRDGAVIDLVYVTGGTPLVRKARFPRGTIPAASVVVQLVTLGVILVIVVPLALALRDTAGAALLLLPVVLAALFCFVLGCALIVSVTHAYFRDVSPTLTAVLVPWFFLTPTFLQLDTIHYVQHHPAVRVLLDWVNPRAPFIEAFRAILYYGNAPSWGRVVYVLAAGAVFLGLGALLFRRMEGDLAVVV